MAALCRQVFGENVWLYVRADDRSRRREPHLKKLRRKKLEPFEWSEEETAAYEEFQNKKSK